MFGAAGLAARALKTKSAGRAANNHARVGATSVPPIKMKKILRNSLVSAFLLAFGAALSPAAVTFTCDPNVNTTVAGLCTTLNTTMAGIYNNTFSNANANIYVQFGVTGLGASVGGTGTLIPYSTFITALTASKNGNQTAALTALNNYVTPVYGAGMMSVSVAYAWSLGIPGITGVTSSGGNCTQGSTGCYAGVVTMTNVPGTFYYRTGTLSPTADDYFTTFEHEVDELLGTSSCIDTNNNVLTDGCGPGIPSAMDLFRYSAAGKLIPVSALSTVPGAYFSYDGGATDPVPGLFFNTLANGSDYADFVASCPGTYHVQDATGCPGMGAGLDITNDGGIEISMLNAAGYNLVTVTNAPTISSNGIVPIFSTVSTIQSGEWISIYGTNLASATAVWKGEFPTTLGGTSVTINGKQAFLWYVSAGQINLQTPNDASTGPVNVVVTTANGTVTSTVTLAQFAPSFNLLDAKHVTGIILRSSGGDYGGGTYDIVGPTGSSFGYPTVAAKAGDSVVLFAVGLGPTTPAVLAGQAYSGAASTNSPVVLRINNVAVTPSFAGISSAGLYQINLIMPTGAGTGDVPLLATVGGVSTQNNVVVSLQ